MTYNNNDNDNKYERNDKKVCFQQQNVPYVNVP